MGTVIALNVVVIVLFMIAGAAIGDRRMGAGFGAWAGFLLSFNLSVLAWAIYVLAHFLGKFW